MSKIKWDQSGERLYETGVSNGVLYPFANGRYGTGIAWNGLTNISESPEGAEATALYADNIKYLNLVSAEEFKGTIEAYTYPDAFAACNGELSLGTGVTIGQQARSQFALCYKTKIGSDESSEEGYKLHIIYGALASPSEKSYATVNDSPEAITFSWEISTTPVDVKGFKPTALVVIDSTKINEDQLTAIENSLYGTDGTTDPETPGTEPTLLMPDDIYDILHPTPNPEEDEEEDVEGQG